MIKYYIPLLDADILNTKAGFKLIYETMLITKDFNKAIKHIFRTRELTMSAANNIIAMTNARYKKERMDYIHAIINNNINN